MRRRAKIGMDIDIVNPARICTDCRSKNLVVVSAEHYRVFATSANNPAVPRFFSACRTCGANIVDAAFMGTGDICSTCAAAAKNALQPEVCFCGASVVSRNTEAAVFSACNENGAHCLYAACKNHAHVVGKVGGPFVPINVYRALGTRASKRKRT